MNLPPCGAARAASAAAWLLGAASLSLAVPAPARADSGYIERVAQEQCTEVREAGADGERRYNAWMASAIDEAAAELDKARDKTVPLAAEWLKLNRELGELKDELERAERYHLIIRTVVAGPFKRWNDAAQELSEMGEDIKSLPSGSAKRKEKQAQYDDLEVEAAALLKKLQAAYREEEFRKAITYFDVNVREIVGMGGSPRTIFLKIGDLGRSVQRTAESKAVIEGKFEAAWEVYQDARAVLEVMKEIDWLVRRCISDQPGAQEMLAATWAGSAMQASGESWAQYCNSGRLLVDFDDAGKAIEGRMTFDCLSMTAEIDGESRYLQRCEPNFRPGVRVIELAVDAASGRIAGQVVEKGRDIGELSGTFQRIGDAPPYGYSGQGTIDFHEEGTHTQARWQTGPRLSCQGAAQPAAD